MTWREQLRPGSFRGVPFFIDGATTNVGRRVAIHEYPLRDTPYTEDLGRRARRFDVELLVIGDDYMTQRDAMLAALEAPGPATLVHPYLGTMSVVLASQARVRETTQNGGMARFTLLLVESGEALLPQATVDTAVQVNSRADAALSTLQTGFTDTFTTTAQPEFVRAAASSLMATAIDDIEAAAGLPLATSALTALTRLATDMRGQLATLVTTPTTLASQTVDLLQQISLIAPDPLAALAAFEDVARFGLGLLLPTGSTPATTTVATNQAAITGLVATAAAVQAARSASGATFATRDEALATLDRLAVLIDTQAQSVDDATFADLTDLRVALVEDLTVRAARLPDLVTFRPVATQPALVIAHNLYGDPLRADELVIRNGVRHPGFVPGGQPLAVLSS